MTYLAYCLIFLGATVVLLFAAALAERRKRRELCSALAILAFVAFACAMALHPDAVQP